jgi:hypothetical protein
VRGVPSMNNLPEWLSGDPIADHLIQCGPEPEEEQDEPQYGREVELTEIFRER